MRSKSLLFGLNATMAAACTSLVAQAAPTRPNIVLIVADDMGYSDLGCYGGEISTPNIDQLAACGVRFSQFYNCARCCPTRASLLTGLYPHQAGIGWMVEKAGEPLMDLGLPGYRGDLSPHAVTIAQALRAAGYRTAMSGKWHITPVTDSKTNWPVQRGFEKFFGIVHGTASYFDPRGILVRDNAIVAPEGENFYLTDAIGDNAVRYVDEFARGAQPFFLYVAFTAPHWPLHARPEDIAKYAGKYRGNWDELREARYRRLVQLGLISPQWQLSPPDRPPAAAATDAHFLDWEGTRMAAYAAQVDRLDQNVGKIMARLRATGAEENTLVFFLSDNGGCAEQLTAQTAGPFVPPTAPDGDALRKGNTPDITPGPADTYASYGQEWANVSNTPFRYYKHFVHEGGIATPLIVCWPREIARPSTTPALGHVIDIMATCLDVAGANYPREFAGQTITPLEGLSLRPVWQGRPWPGHAAIGWEHEGNRAIRAGDWKLVARRGGDWTLYNLAEDRTELHNVAAKNPAKVAELRQLYDAWAARCGVVPWEQVKF